MMKAFEDRLNELLRFYNVAIIKPVSETIIRAVLDSIGPVPDELYRFYKHTNGLVFEWLTIFPIEDRTNIKRTWNSIQKANDINKSVYLGKNGDLFNRFVIIAEISAGNCAVVDRNDFSIWFEEDGLHQTNLSLIEFIDLSLKEVKM